MAAIKLNHSICLDPSTLCTYIYSYRPNGCTYGCITSWTTDLPNGSRRSTFLATYIYTYKTTNSVFVMGFPMGWAIRTITVRGNDNFRVQPMTVGKALSFQTGTTHRREFSQAPNSAIPQTRSRKYLRPPGTLYRIVLHCTQINWLACGCIHFWGGGVYMYICTMYTDTIAEMELFNEKERQYQTNKCIYIHTYSINGMQYPNFRYCLCAFLY